MKMEIVVPISIIGGFSIIPFVKPLNFVPLISKTLASMAENY